MTESGVSSDLLFSRLSNILASQEEDTSRPMALTTPHPFKSLGYQRAVIDGERMIQAAKGASSQRRRLPGHRSSDDFCGGQARVLGKTWESHVGAPLLFRSHKRIYREAKTGSVVIRKSRGPGNG